VNEIIQRNKKGFWYANVWHEGIRLRDCLFTDDRKEAQKRLADLYVAVERGEYLQSKETFEDRAKQYNPVSLKGIYKGQPSKDKQRTLDYHLLHRFKGKTVVQVEEELEGWVDEMSKANPDSTCKKVFQVMTELGFEYAKAEGLEGKSFDRDQILTEEDVLRVIQDHVMPQYKTLCLVASYSGLRLKNVAELRKKDVNLRSGWLKVNQSKTGKVVEVPITATLRAVFSKIPSPLRPDDLFFPNVNTKAIATQVTRAFNRAGIPWASFHHFRHFTACHLLDNRHSVEEIRDFLGHKLIETTLDLCTSKTGKFEETRRVFGHRLDTNFNSEN
jgi:integrase